MAVLQAIMITAATSVEETVQEDMNIISLDIPITAYSQAMMQW
ncbi:MAG: hypothetical protein QM743_07580 [Chitinophagaceae bacterium]